MMPSVRENQMGSESEHSLIKQLSHAGEKTMEEGQRAAALVITS